MAPIPSIRRSWRETKDSPRRSRDELRRSKGSLRESNRRRIARSALNKSFILIRRPDPSLTSGILSNSSIHSAHHEQRRRPFKRDEVTKPPGSPEDMMSSSLPDECRQAAPDTEPTKFYKGVGPGDAGFLQNLVDRRIYPNEYEYPDGRVAPLPNNRDEIIEKLTRRRPSLSPSRYTFEDFKTFTRADAHATTARQVTTSVIPYIEGTLRNPNTVSGRVHFTNIELPSTGGTLLPCKPDTYHGARPEQLHREVRTELSRYIVPSEQDHLPIVPNFFFEVLGPDESAAVAREEVLYDGAVGARAMYGLYSYGHDEAVSSDVAMSITATYHDGQLKMHVTHLVEPASPEDEHEIFTNQLHTWGMTGDIESFRSGAKAIRNAIDWAKEQRDEGIKRANQRFKARRPQSQDPFSDAMPNIIPPNFASAFRRNENSPIPDESPTAPDSMDYHPELRRSKRNQHKI